MKNKRKTKNVLEPVRRSQRVRGLSPHTSVAALRATLDKLRLRAGDRVAVRDMLAILVEDLGVRVDVTYHTLVETKIGETVRLLSRHEDPLVAAAVEKLLKR